MFDRNRWLVAEHDQNTVKILSESLSLDPLCAKLLINRGYTEPQKAKAYIAKSDSFLYNPYLLKDVDRAINRIKRALKNGEKITIYGDYDVDGVTSVSVLYMYLKEHGADVDYYIPTREHEGYGLNISAFQTISENGTKLVITVDTGITAIQEIDYAKSIGLDVVVTDHHQCRQELPNCDAVVNPKRMDCQYPFKELSGVGVIFKVLCALELDFVNCGEYNLFTIKDMCRRYIDLVTIGTIADVMPLYDENRIMVYMGLGMLAKPRNIGIRALFRAVGIDSSKKITSSVIGYTIAPRINAAGRIGNAARAVQLFLSESPRLAEIIADELCLINKERQQTENLIFEEALTQIEEEHDLDNESVLVLSSDHWHQGVIGIVASKITERFGKPSILISFDSSVDGKMIGKGSARSIKGLNMVEALSFCDNLLVKYGGHELAAGLSVEQDSLCEFKEKLNKYASEKLSSPDSAPKTFIEAEITDADVTMEMVEEFSKLEPYGAKNPEPIFVLRNVIVQEIVPLSMGKHTRLILEKNETEMSAVFFGHNLITEGFCVGDSVDVVCSININEFRGNKTVQLILRDLDFSLLTWDEIQRAEEEFQDVCLGNKRIDEDEIPNRADFAAIYHVLRDPGFIRGKAVTIMKLIASTQNITYLKANIILRVFEESELIELSKIDTAKFHIKRLDAVNKRNLPEAPLMKILVQK